jgi:hypothetical protein
VYEISNGAVGTSQAGNPKIEIRGLKLRVLNGTASCAFAAAVSEQTAISTGSCRNVFGMIGDQRA